MKKEIEAFVNAASEQELDAAWNNLSAEEQRVFEQLMEEEPPEDALAFFAQLYDDTPKEQASETVSISENEIYFKRQPLTEEQKKHLENPLFLCREVIPCGFQLLLVGCVDKGFDLFFHGASSFGCEKRFFKKYGFS